MRRHGWAFSLGLLACGTVAAQPPAGAGHSPPAPDLPGVVIAQYAPDRSPVNPVVPPFTDRAPKTVAPEPGPLHIESTPVPAEGTPVSSAIQTLPGTPCATPAPAAGCEKRGFGSLSAWCNHRSRAGYGLKVPFPYYPPLQAWFPCEPRWPIVAYAAPCAAKAPCPAPCGSVPPGNVIAGPDPMAPSPPAGVVPGRPQVGCPASPACLEGDVLSGFKKVGDGLNFAPGVAPMSDPTKQVHRVSHWRPK
jgi:hypothetical protein